MVIYEAELPDNVDILIKIKTLDELDNTKQKELKEIKDFYLTTAVAVSRDLDKYIKNKLLVSSPEEAISKLEDFDLFYSGMIGLGEGLGDKLDISSFVRLSNESHGTDNKKKMAVSAIEKYAKEESTSVWGMVKALTGHQKNIQSKVFTLKGRGKRF